MKYLNLGCGRRFHPDWTNVDFASKDQEVLTFDLRKGIPFPEASFDVVYHSHLLEHLPRNSAKRFLLECYRILRPEGILRVVVPDLEQLAHMYLSTLEKASDGSSEWAANYEWIVLEMYDQAIRHFPGGEIATYLTRPNILNQEFIVNRWGKEAVSLMERKRKNKLPQPSGPKLKDILSRGGERLQKLLHASAGYREKLLRLLLGDDYHALQIGRFRQGGEIHHWMYDRYSLAILLEHCGFQHIIRRSAIESYVPEWEQFCLDSELDGTMYKPDSLYMEAIKKA